MATVVNSRCHEKHTVINKMSEYGSDLQCLHPGTEPVCLIIGNFRLLTFNIGSSVVQYKRG